MNIVGGKDANRLWGQLQSSWKRWRREGQVEERSGGERERWRREGGVKERSG